MRHTAPITTDEIRTRFARALSDLYRAEVPLYADLLDLVADTNADALAADPALRARLERTDGLGRIDGERHGAIRLGTAAELATMRRLFAVLGMSAVGYYDLSAAGVPVHSTAFRPVREESLARNPFRVFTSLLRLELIADPDLRAAAAALLARRRIFTPGALALIERFEHDGGLSAIDADRFVREALETFRWHSEATVDAATYRRFSEAHPLLADVVCFRGPHINHLTPRTLDIDAVQAGMRGRGIVPKDVIEGPPTRACPILLRQTSFRALSETIRFPGAADAGTHTARFGEVEQRGLALTRAGRARYDRLLAGVRDADSAGSDYGARLRAAFADFPDDHATLRDERLGFFGYACGAVGLDHDLALLPIETLVASGHVQAYPIVYEDFLPVSAAGIFQSNLGASARDGGGSAPPARGAFVAALGSELLDEFQLYEEAEARSIAAIRATGQGAALDPLRAGPENPFVVVGTASG